MVQRPALLTGAYATGSCRLLSRWAELSRGAVSLSTSRRGWTSAVRCLGRMAASLRMLPTSPCTWVLCQRQSRPRSSTIRVRCLCKTCVLTGNHEKTVSVVYSSRHDFLHQAFSLYAHVRQQGPLYQIVWFCSEGPGSSEGLKEGETVVTNHPVAGGGSHLPDITVITPVWDNGAIVFFVASRGHHADVGGISPGSMPPHSKTLVEEGALITSFKLVRDGLFQVSIHTLCLLI